MSLKMRILIAIILVTCLIIIVNMIRKRSLELKYTLLWIFCDIALLIIDFFPFTMRKLADFLGIISPANMMFFLGFLFALMLIFSLTVSLSRETVRVRKLAQMVALREDENTLSDEEEMKEKETVNFNE